MFTHFKSTRRYTKTHGKTIFCSGDISCTKYKLRTKYTAATSLHEHVNTVLLLVSPFRTTISHLKSTHAY